ncbi:putative iron-regulated membrane protein [Comamonas sp. BIGb0152]|uniref:PepSY-associated TM helix domain-containing protein n=1 Tax=Comamonas sp. BIGb0152 TaxID=2940601 RepID=UPI0021677F28|nr:PepSY-associated TM helix domain-containing protein [Comamonas sp. BIGb0152]MCS4293473.1 putative iron-regulated membrane protein [Comamonas sp. BIGb0152]
MSPSTRKTWQLLIRRLHLYIGLLVAPFIVVAAATGLLYAVTPQLENQLYRSALKATHPPGAQAQPLSAQVQAALHSLPAPATVVAVRPAPDGGSTTRVMVADAALGTSEYRSLFVNPYTLALQGDLTVYGTSGVLPLRKQLDLLHRQLLMGEWGRTYSELAASWLWLSGLGGVALWWLSRPQRASANKGMLPPLRRWHHGLGLWLLVGLLFLSATGLTWSRWAGGHFGQALQQMGWQTPRLNTNLSTDNAGAHAHHQPADPHADHAEHQAVPMAMAGMTAMAPTPQDFDTALALARQHGLASAKLEIRPPAAANKAWTVTEINRSWPTEVDALAIDLAAGKVLHHNRFSDYPLASKLTRWGIDLHMGSWGVLNQALLVLLGAGIVAMALTGWLQWRKRPGRSREWLHGQLTLVHQWRQLPRAAALALLLVAVALGWLLPVLGCSLLALLALDAWIYLRR